ncbi:zinc finger CCCH domain-containing protein 13-like [Eriocheir sinensis]|uniref:zinc finger CCCH domain-containing protein 13-like n=1 Tax=Eriocheir sinensis TaxID=95602 RepID=UPI0021C71581|nr:zinc finger CCCH domain-containing protein 13-like [Eriocheir sinensis]XP_050690036.1 zinc finger CCCH domain-containing protein 13-like [Eriocheir sinensis]XP_050690037.1 zinc finger CCCH domain-containing protein 13-like [Eriocheir sinensis]XP_050690038.1 zinc finger CCCH domain-containing protein 13-like [Eriocheir sinensis]
MDSDQETVIFDTGNLRQRRYFHQADRPPPHPPYKPIPPPPAHPTPVPTYSYPPPSHTGYHHSHSSVATSIPSPHVPYSAAYSTSLPLPSKYSHPPSTSLTASTSSYQPSTSHPPPPNHSFKQPSTSHPPTTNHSFKQSSTSHPPPPNHSFKQPSTSHPPPPNHSFKQPSTSHPPPPNHSFKQPSTSHPPPPNHSFQQPSTSHPPPPNHSFQQPSTSHPPAPNHSFQHPRVPVHPTTQHGTSSPSAPIYNMQHSKSRSTVRRRRTSPPRFSSRYKKMRLNTDALDHSGHGLLDSLRRNGVRLHNCWEREIIPRVPRPHPAARTKSVEVEDGVYGRDRYWSSSRTVMPRSPVNQLPERYKQPSQPCQSPRKDNSDPQPARQAISDSQLDAFLKQTNSNFGSTGFIKAMLSSLANGFTDPIPAVPPPPPIQHPQDTREEVQSPRKDQIPFPATPTDDKVILKVVRVPEEEEDQKHVLVFEKASTPSQNDQNTSSPHSRTDPSALDRITAEYRLSSPRHHASSHHVRSRSPPPPLPPHSGLNPLSSDQQGVKNIPSDSKSSRNPPPCASGSNSTSQNPPSPCHSGSNSTGYSGWEERASSTIPPPSLSPSPSSISTSRKSSTESRSSEEIRKTKSGKRKASEVEESRDHRKRKRRKGDEGGREGDAEEEADKRKERKKKEKENDDCRKETETKEKENVDRRKETEKKEKENVDHRKETEKKEKENVDRRREVKEKEVAEKKKEDRQKKKEEKENKEGKGRQKREKEKEEKKKEEEKEVKKTNKKEEREKEIKEKQKLTGRQGKEDKEEKEMKDKDKRGKQNQRKEVEDREDKRRKEKDKTKQSNRKTATDKDEDKNRGRKEDNKRRNKENGDKEDRKKEAKTKTSNKQENKSHRKMDNRMSKEREEEREDNRKKENKKRQKEREKEEGRGERMKEKKDGRREMEERREREMGKGNKSEERRKKGRPSEENEREEERGDSELRKRNREKEDDKENEGREREERRKKGNPSEEERREIGPKNKSKSTEGKDDEEAKLISSPTRPRPNDDIHKRHKKIKTEERRESGIRRPSVDSDGEVAIVPSPSRFRADEPGYDSDCSMLSIPLFPDLNPDDLDDLPPLPSTPPPTTAPRRNLTCNTPVKEEQPTFDPTEAATPPSQFLSPAVPGSTSVASVGEVAVKEEAEMPEGCTAELATVKIEPHALRDVSEGETRVRESLGVQESSAEVATVKTEPSTVWDGAEGEVVRGRSSDVRNHLEMRVKSEPGAIQDRLGVVRGRARDIGVQDSPMGTAMVKQEPGTEAVMVAFEVRRGVPEASTGALRVKEEPLEYTDMGSSASYGGDWVPSSTIKTEPWEYTEIIKTETFLQRDGGRDRRLRQLMDATLRTMGLEDGEGIPTLWDGSTPESLYDHLKSYLVELGCGVWEAPNESFTFNWEVNLRRLAVASQASHDLDRFTRNIYRHMKEHPTYKAFVTDLMRKGRGRTAR